MPGQRGQSSIDDLKRRPSGAIVEQPVGIEARHDRSVLGESFERRGCRRAGVDPTVERGDERGCDEIARIVEGVEAHG